MYSDCYLKDDVDAVSAEKLELVITCKNIISICEKADFIHVNNLQVKLKQHIDTLQAYHNKKNKRDMDLQNESINRGIRI